MPGSGGGFFFAAFGKGTAVAFVQAAPSQPMPDGQDPGEQKRKESGQHVGQSDPLPFCCVKEWRK